MPTNERTEQTVVCEAEEESRMMIKQTNKQKNEAQPRIFV